MIYAYVTSQCCVRRDAVNPGEYIGDRRVHTHGDYEPWPYGKRETRAIINGTHPAYINAGAGADAYLRASARAVAKMKGWEVRHGA